MAEPIEGWRPKGAAAAVCFSIDDVHPSTSLDPYEAGGEHEHGVLGHLAWLLERHPRLHATLFVTPAWRMTSGRPSRSWRSRLPVLRRILHLDDLHAPGTFRLDRHPEFCRYLRQLPRTELALHGLHHVRRGEPVHVEFLTASYRACRRRLKQGATIFEDAELPRPRGLSPPGWHLSAELARAAADVGLDWVTSSRDLDTPIEAEARSAGSGLCGAPLIHPARLMPSGLVHFPTNFQATSTTGRALDILDAGGLLSIKAHAAKRVGDHVMKDGLDQEYRDRLHELFSELEDRYGDELAWTSFGGLAARVVGAP